MPRVVIEAMFLSCLPQSHDGELLSDLVRRIRSVRARHSRLPPTALAQKELDLMKAWMEARGLELSPDLRERFMAA